MAKKLGPLTWFRYDNRRLVGIRYPDGSEVDPDVIRQINEADDERQRKIASGEIPHPGPFEVRLIRRINPGEENEDQDESEKEDEDGEEN